MITANTNTRVFWAALVLFSPRLLQPLKSSGDHSRVGIVDPNGAVVTRSKVEIKNIETAIVSTAITGEDGSYSFPLLPPGKYQLTVTKENKNELCSRCAIPGFTMSTK